MEATSVKLIAWLALGMSVYAALVATIVGAWTVYGIWRDRVFIKIKVSYTYGSGRWQRSSAFKGNEVDQHTRIVVRATVGRRPVPLSDGGILSRDGTHFEFEWAIGGGRAPSPGTVDAGQFFELTATLDQIHEAWKELTIELPIWAYWETEAGQVCKSKLPKEVQRVLLDGFGG